MRAHTDGRESTHPHMQASSYGQILMCLPHSSPPGSSITYSAARRGGRREAVASVCSVSRESVCVWVGGMGGGEDE